MAAHVFISYSNKDAVLVQQLKDDLASAGVEVWLDHERLTPDTLNWQEAIRKGIDQATHVIYAASETAARSPYVAHELAMARGKQKSILSFWIRGVEWYECAPMGFYLAQYTDGRSDHFNTGVTALLKALGLNARSFVNETVSNHRLDIPARLTDLGFQLQIGNGGAYVLSPLIVIPAGKFRLGSDQSRDPYARYRELKRVEADLPDFCISRYPVTVAEYAYFVQSGKSPQPQSRFNALSWIDQLAECDHPVVNVTLWDATKYADWLSELTGKMWRLPTADEWEKAARYDPDAPSGASSERIYPWGDEFEPARCNTDESGINRTSPVGWYNAGEQNQRAGRRSGASPCGVEDMSGNVWEWVATQQEYGQPIYIARGGCWGGNRVSVRATNSHAFSYSEASICRGFRLICVAAHDKALIAWNSAIEPITER